MIPLYTAQARSIGAARNGRVMSDDGVLDFDLRSPKELGGPGNAPNPEMLFAAGYAACFHNALQHLARQRKVILGDSAVDARVSMGRLSESDGYTLAVALDVTLPALSAEAAHQIVEDAHRACPYSNATRGNIEVLIRVL